MKRHRPYVQVGDYVYHERFRQWGLGTVVEVWSSMVAGGPCLAKIQFQDGNLRVFNNNLENSSCCYYTGVTKTGFARARPPRP